MQIHSSTESKRSNPFPFNNLFLIKGYVTGQNQFWMYLGGVVAAFLGYAAFQLLLSVPLIAAATKNGIAMSEIVKNPNILFNPDAIGMNKSLLLALMMGMFVSTLLFLWLAIKFFHHKPLSSVITGYEKIRWKRYFFSFTVWAGLIILLTLVSYITSPQDLELRFDAGSFVILLIVVVVFIPIQTATEEILFRGYLIQGISQIDLSKSRLVKYILRNKKIETQQVYIQKLAFLSEKTFRNGIIPLMITSVLFGLLHGSNPEAKAHGLLIMMPYYILFGAFLGLLTLLDEGAELAMGIHCANNLVSSLLITSKNSVLQTDAIFYTTTENPAAEFVTWLIMAAICFFILFKKYKLSNWNLLIK